MTTKAQRFAATAQVPRRIRLEEGLLAQGIRITEQALRVIEGEGNAAQYLARLNAHQADPDELALIVSMLCGEALRGFCRVIDKALGGLRRA